MDKYPFNVMKSNILPLTVDWIGRFMAQATNLVKFHSTF